MISFAVESKVYPLAHKALDYRSLRQDLIAGNIANQNTPYYRPRDIEFTQALALRQDEILYKKPSRQLQLAQSNKGHLSLESSRTAKFEHKPDLFFRDGHLARNDGNSVDLDIETSEMGKNSVVYQGLTVALKKHKGILNYAIEAGKNIS
ncbi:MULTISPECIES: flagellar basal body rod protein FlgB [Helicobacter]|uniref:Flagellar basal body rod protein FlgB n=1 Tax=Helicobacter macacae MIT 99-5501 TaxID=1357400 RepID=V8C5Z7_9HELI|nr:MULTISPECIES: flagellar basal body rod protein FlgB [Helicobacter]ETD22472.1 flagellar basal-body rod protein FlgB [Helicobacter macacae MIT 99-5501]RDU53078.1 flagellar basal body rod protein FlgB [Helicobacter sp. MIT 01-3238]